MPAVKSRVAKCRLDPTYKSSPLRHEFALQRLGESFVCRAINPELAGETVVLKDIIRAHNRRRRELRTTLAEREATVEALLRLRRGEDAQPEPLFPEPDPASATPPARPRLKSYYNE